MSDLVKETRQLAKKTKLPVAEICEAAGVSSRWFYRFRAGDFSDPGFNRIQRLHVVLSAEELRSPKQEARA